MRDNLGLPDTFYFTQHSLATFEACPLKFRKRYIEGIKWKSRSDVNMTEQLGLGVDFHLLARRYFLGIDDITGIGNIPRVKLHTWVENLKKTFELNKGYRYLPEYKLRLNNGTLRLEANYDLVIIKDDCLEIWDWKTGTNAPGTEKRVRDYGKTLQTMVYMYILREKAGIVYGARDMYKKLGMYYWNPDPPGIAAKIPYDDYRHKSFGDSLQKRVDSILNYDYSGFDRSGYIKSCRYCEYNFICYNSKAGFTIQKETRL